jgi:NAD(P)-dependent dehydrogenase (short-subunit alcohol dehydrogenase family)
MSSSQPEVGDHRQDTNSLVETQIRNLPLIPTPGDCAGRVFIVVGANSGLGYEAAKHLVTLGSAKVIMTVRNIPAGEEAKAAIESSTGISGVAEVWELDLSSYDSVQAFAKRANELARIDSLIENAGVAMSKKVLAEGHVLSLTVNVLSTLLLALLLLPKLSETSTKFGTTAHISIVTSRACYSVGQPWLKMKNDPFTGMDESPVEPLK